jgi:outer membrane biosynthesis protein TonB
MRSSRLSLYLFLSLLLHILLLLLIASGVVKLPNSYEVPVSSESTITLLEESPIPAPQIQPAPARQQSAFVPTVAGQETDKPNPKAPLESERNTALRSTSPTRDANSALPDMRGDPRSSLNYLNTPGSAGEGNQPPQQASPAQPPQPQVAQQQPTPPQPKPQQQNQQEAQQAAQPSPQPNKAPDKPTPRIEDALPLLPPEQQKPSSQVAQQTNQQSPTQHTQASPQQAPRPPPASFAMNRSDTRGRGVNIPGMPSPEARDTELGRYKQKMYRAVGSRWQLDVARSLSFLAIGSVRIKFFVRANGVIENIRIADDSGSNNNSTEMLKTISLDAIVKSAPFEPFSETMKQQLGSGYDEEFTFSIY